MKKIFTLAVIAIAIVLFIASCNKDINLDNWAPKVLGPLINGYATVEEVSDLRDKTFHQKVYPEDLHYQNYDFTNYTGNVPAMTINHVGPYGYSLSEYFHSVYVDSADFVITIQNVFPITISAGTHVVFRTEPDTTNPGNIVLDYVLPNDIPAYQTSSFETPVYNTYVSDSLFLYLDQFHTPGATNATFTSDFTYVTFQIKFLHVFNVVLNVNKTYTIWDTASANITESVPNADNSAATGKVSVFLTDGMPIKFSFQIYFLDENFNFVDSLYHGGQMITDGAHTDVNGTLLDSVERKYETILTADRIGLLKTAKHVVYRLTGDTYGYSPPYDYMGAACYYHALITGDLKIQVTKFISL